MADWSLLPKDLLGLINGRSKTCFEIVHFLSVCSSWRSAVPPPSYGNSIGSNFLLPVFNHNPRFEGDDTHCKLTKIQVFLLRFQTPFGADCLLVGMSQKKSGKLKLSSPLEGSWRWRYKHGITLNTLSSQIISVGDYYQIKFYAITTRRYRTRREKYSKRVAFLELDSEDGKCFVVLAGVLGDLMMYRSCDKKWTKIEDWYTEYRDIVSFKGEFYVVDMRGTGHVFVIKPSLEISEIQQVTQSHETFDERLIVSGEELLLVQRITPGEYCHEHKHAWFRLFRLENKGQRKWVRVIDLEDRVVFLGFDWNLCYSAKELPGMKGNCVVFFDPKYSNEILVFDLRTRKTSDAYTECRGYMGAFGENQESLLSCGIVICDTQKPAKGSYTSSSEGE
ncbi:putative F-box protein [Cardamine amara subsp. amara]|uniref:F-box protein n=1 Tax=Cardamine amara subsp. amara TaxID=228776 RepID=A0ABD1ACH8_CARAN